jgi:hypothetical protein
MKLRRRPGRLLTVPRNTIKAILKGHSIEPCRAAVLKTRTVEIAGITRQPDETWMTQVARI